MKTALVTGASGGMGSATVRALIRSGYTVYGLDFADAKPCEGLTFLKTDLRDRESVKRAFETLRAQGVQFDCIVHMAGIYDLNSLIELSEEDLTRIFQINLFGVYRVNKTFLPLLRDHARILITTSELAPLDPLPFTGIYAITKAALEKYAFSLRMELQLLGHSVIVLRPGAVDTGLLNVSEKRLDAFTENTRLYRVSAARFHKIVSRVESRKVKPESIARLALKALSAKRPKYVYQKNRNPGLLCLNALPDRMQNAIIRRLLRVNETEQSS